MGIVKISDELHDEIRTSSAVMSRSINAQAEFWMKIGMLSELNPTLTFQDIVRQQLLKERLSIKEALIE
ncbi:MAG: hypothetical protein COA68_04940 [Oceanobacter sp.]|jgi:hypothetical protein|nr:MAG: hypothetical protein COA68_04940 [Oceanobacter sp.]|tara:strand:- start:841 stop:1047 length:207 start_codon:yes stop_codon:yes gene_type:complete